MTSTSTVPIPQRLVGLGQRWGQGALEKRQARTKGQPLPGKPPKHRLKVVLSRDRLGLTMEHEKLVSPHANHGHGAQGLG